jgi:cyclic pyranopterin phosphate synthase
MEEIITIISLCAKIGFTHIKFTGGEPLLRSDLTEIIAATKRIPGIKEIQMVTNGTLLAGRATELKAAGLDWITISLDAAEPEAFWRIRGTNLSTVLKAIRECCEVGLPARINMVVMKSNLNQIPLMISLASELGCSLKLLDLICLDIGRSLEFWRQEFVQFNLVRNMLEKLGAELVGREEAPGGIGAPLLDYRLPNGPQVVVKDSTQGTYYHSSCKTCKNYPCQDALISVRVTHDGCLKRCLIRNDNLVPLLPLLHDGHIAEAASAINETFVIMTESSYHPFAWNPDSLLERGSGNGTNTNIATGVDK